MENFEIKDYDPNRARLDMEFIELEKLIGSDIMWAADKINTLSVHFKIHPDQKSSFSSACHKLLAMFYKRYVVQEVERLKEAHYAGWYNGMVNAYKHEFSWEQFKNANNL
jgi:hypothetical protein